MIRWKIAYDDDAATRDDARWDVYETADSQYREWEWLDCFATWSDAWAYVEANNDDGYCHCAWCDTKPARR